MPELPSNPWKFARRRLAWLKMAATRAEGLSTMGTWQYSIGHAWRYDRDDVPAGMKMRFEISEEAKAAGLCGCECGVCEPDRPHTAEDGCVCETLGCPCLDPAADGSDGSQRQRQTV